MKNGQNDIQIIHHLWWLTQYFNKYTVKGREYKDIINEELDEDTAKELDSLVAYIKENY